MPVDGPLDPPDHPARSVPREVARGQLRLVSTLTAPDRDRLARVVPVLAPKPQLRLARDTDAQVRLNFAMQPHLLPSAQVVLCEVRGTVRERETVVSRLARNASLAAAAARVAATHTSLYVLSELAGNVSSPVDVLEGLSSHSAETVSRKALDNPNNPLGLERSRYGTPREFHVAAAASWHADVQLLRELSLGGDPWTLEALAANRTAPVDVLEHLALSTSDGVLAALAGNPSITRFCALALMRGLSGLGRPSRTVTLRLAGNPGTPPDVLEDLDEDNGASAQVQGLLARNPSSPRSLLVRYLEIGGIQVQKKVVRNVRFDLDLLRLTPVRALEPLLLAAYCVTSPEWETVRSLAENWQGTLGELLETCDILA